MVLTTTMVFAQTESDGIELVLLNHTCTRGPSVTRMQDFFWCSTVLNNKYIFHLAQLQICMETKYVLPIALGSTYILHNTMPRITMSYVRLFGKVFPTHCCILHFCNNLI